MNQEEGNEKFRISSFLPLHSGGISWPLTQESFIPYYESTNKTIFNFVAIYFGY